MKSNKIYIRSIDKQCIEKQISYPVEILENFFDNNPNDTEIEVEGKTSHITTKVLLKLATDPRLSNTMKDALEAEGAMEIGDLFVMYKVKERKYIVELVKKGSEKHNQLSSLIREGERHALILDDGKIQNLKLKLHDNPQNGGENWIFYGAPGCGKSHELKKKLQDIEEENKFRVTFHPEYTNSDFVGQILPTIQKDEKGNDQVKYIFNAGPFTKALEKALTTSTAVYLIIEEINRGNAASIFGDIFQLLDRQKAEKDDETPNEDYGKSEYEITNPNIEDYLKERIELPENFKVYIPRNMFVWATMNSSDQNVFTLDTAFKRRWNFKQITNDIKADKNHKYKEWHIPGTDVTWEKFLTVINPSILDYKIRNHTNEDKQLGKYFVGRECLTKDVKPVSDPECCAKAEQFAYKVLEYLWNDVCKIDKDEWFDTNTYRTLEELIYGFVHPQANQNPLSVFKGIDFTK